MGKTLLQVHYEIRAVASQSQAVTKLEKEGDQPKAKEQKQH